MASNDLIASLIDITLPHLSQEDKEDKEDFIFSVLNSNLGGAGVTSQASNRKDWDRLIADLERQVRRQSGSSSNSTNQFNQLCNELKNQTIPHTKKEAILSFLLELGPVPTSSSSNARVVGASSSRNTTSSRSQHAPTSSTSSSRPLSSATMHVNGRPTSSYTPPQPQPSSQILRENQPPPSSTPASSSSHQPIPPNPQPLPQEPQIAQSMFSLLQSHRATFTPNSSSSSSSNLNRSSPPVPESLLLEDMVHILQGHQGHFVRFKPSQPKALPVYRSGVILLDLDRPSTENGEGSRQRESEEEDGSGIEFILEGTGYSLPATTRALIHELSELGWLLNKINRVIKVEYNHHNLTHNNSVKGKEKGGGSTTRRIGMVEQALHAALKEEVTKYLKLIADIEINRKESLRVGRGGAGGGLTLRRLLVMTAELKLIMRMMGTLVDDAGGETVGGALLTALHSRTSNGDPFIRAFSSELLKKLSVPFFATLASWIYEGELNDPFDEFFVKLNPIVAEDEAFASTYGGEGREGEGEEGRVKGYELWEKKFTFRKEMLPGFLEEAFGRKIFSTGKSLNFMKCSCKEAAWVSERNRDGSSRTLEYADMAGLERSITLAFSVASQRLFDTFFDRYRLLDHLKALKDYVMLGKGDFTDILMQNLGPVLFKSASTLYAQNFTTALDNAKSYANYLADHPNTHNKLDARILQTYLPGDRFQSGESGWEVFILAYGVETPLDTVLDPKSLEEYSKMFKHLWSIKRVEFGLSGISRRLITSQKVFARVPALTFQFHTARIALAEMIFFIRELQYYCHLEVIACSWADLETFALKKEGDLDSLIKAHKVYLERLVTKALLQSSKLVGTGQRITNDENSPEEKISMFDLLKRIFKHMLLYREVADTLCDFAIAEAARLEIPRDLSRGLTINPPSRQTSADHAKTLEEIERLLEKYSGEFRDMAIRLVQALGTAPDLDMKFLSVRLNFNHHFVNTSK